MREIKFRGKTLYDFIEKVSSEYEIPQGTFVYGSLVFDCNKNPFIDIQGYNNGIGFKSQYLVDANTVGQFTGLHDKNGKEIYEGDIVKTRLSQNFFGIVTWHTDGYFFFDTSNGEWKRWGNGYRPAGEMLRFRCDGGCFDFEVVGNIYDNPDLLKDNGEESI